MLVLSRKEGERIKLGDNIEITVVRLGGDRVRLGIDAPMDVTILRGELTQDYFNRQKTNEPSSMEMDPAS